MGNKTFTVICEIHTHSGVRFAQVLWLRNRRKGDGVNTKKLKELIGQSAPRFIFPNPRYFNYKVLKLRFVIMTHIIFPYTNYTAA